MFGSAVPTSDGIILMRSSEGMGVSQMGGITYTQADMFVSAPSGVGQEGRKDGNGMSLQASISQPQQVVLKICI